jgi:transcriptional regulator with XRE-family HTH domain
MSRVGQTEVVDERLGNRIGRLRVEHSYTQAELAERVGISRVAVSHLESSRTVASERTVALLAGIFDREPHQLVAGTDYPPSKAERLPVVAARYTEVEHQLGVLDAELRLVEKLPPTIAARERQRLADEWGALLRGLVAAAVDGRERDRLRAALDGLNRLR